MGQKHSENRELSRFVLTLVGIMTRVSVESDGASQQFQSN